MSPGTSRLAVPRPADVVAGPGGRPETADRPLRRRYWEVVTVDGRDLVVFRELADGRWFRHR